MADPEHRRWIDKVPWWADWLTATIIAVILFNISVTSAGDPLSGVRGVSAAGGSAGITEAARTSFYASITISGAVLAAAALIIMVFSRQFIVHTALAARAFGFLAASGIAGLLLDYMDGPVRTVQLVVYVAVTLSIVRFARLLIAVGSPPNGSEE